MLNINTSAQAKKSARALEKALERNGITLQHGKALDVLASLCGRQDWNALSQALSPEGVDSLLSHGERQHAADAAGDDYGRENMLVAHTGFQLRYSAETEMCDYVRVCDPLGRELVYWTSSEWAEDPEVVMGAMLGALVRGKPVEVSNGTPAAPAPVSTSVARMPTIQDVCFTDVSAVCIDGGSGYRMNYVEDQVVGLLDEVGSEEFEEQKDENAIFMEREDDGELVSKELTLAQLASLKWDTIKQMFVSPNGVTYEFYFPVTMQAWFQATNRSVAASPAQSAPSVDAPFSPATPVDNSLRMFTATLRGSAAPLMQVNVRIAGYGELDAKARLAKLYNPVPSAWSDWADVTLVPTEAWEMQSLGIYVDGGYYNSVTTLEEAVRIADAVEPTASDEVTIEDQDGNCVWTIKALGDPESSENA